MQRYAQTRWVHLLALTAVLMVPACTDPADDHVAIFDPVQPKKNAVALTNVEHDVHFTAGSKLLTPVEAQSLAGFLKDNGVAAGDAVTIGLSEGDSVPLAAGRQEAVTAALKPMRVKAVPAANLVEAANAVRLTVARYVVTPPSCPDWSRPEADNTANNPSSNFGCATEAGLALMVADPGDLVHGVKPGPADGEALARGITLYRSGALSKSLGTSTGAASTGASSAGLTGGAGQ